MGRRAIVLSLAALAGCSFVDDFDKFRPVGDGSEEDGGNSERDSGGDATGEVRNDAAVPPRDGAAMDDGGPRVMDDGGPIAVSDGSLADAAIVDAYVPPPACGGVICDDGDPCTRDSCDGSRCVSTVLDADRDGFSPGACKAGSAVKGGDCNDADNKVSPGATEVCDEVDNDCDGMKDEGSEKIQCYPDLDRDDFANLDGKPVAACKACPEFTLAVTDPNDRSKHDCFDSAEYMGIDVFPGQTNWKGEGYGPGGKNDKLWDYDCSGQIETELKPLEGGCVGLLGLVCDSSQGFVGEKVPGCGETGPYQICRQNGLTCAGTTESRQQRCH